MATMNISVTGKMRAWVESRVAAGDYATASDCVRDLLRDRIEHDAKLAVLREEIRKGDESGPAEPFDFEQFIADARTSSSGT